MDQSSTAKLTELVLELKSELLEISDDEEIVKTEPAEPEDALSAHPNAPLFDKSLTLPDQNENERNIDKNRACSVIEVPEDENITSKKRKLDSKPKEFVQFSDLKTRAGAGSRGVGDGAKKEVGGEAKKGQAVTSSSEAGDMAGYEINRKRRVSMKQIDILCEFLRSNKDIATAFNRSLQAKEYSARKWREIAEVLNAQGDGAQRDAKLWSKYWVDLKAKLKRRNATILSSRRQPGGKTSVEPLSAIEEKFLHILGEDFGRGLAETRVDQLPEASNSRTTVGTDTPVSETIVMRKTPVILLKFLEEVPQEAVVVATKRSEDIPAKPVEGSAELVKGRVELVKSPVELVESPAELVPEEPVASPAQPQRPATSPGPTRRRRSRLSRISQEDARQMLVQSAQERTAAAVRSSAAMEGIQQSMAIMANAITALQENVNDIKRSTHNGRQVTPLEEPAQLLEREKTSEKAEQLIEIVRNYAALYDPSHAQYKNIKTKSKIWDGIANVMGEKDGETVKAMWENLKDCYSRYYRASLAEPITTNKRDNEMPWVDQMFFLQPFLECLTPVTPNVTQTEIKSSQTTVDSSINPCGEFLKEESTLFNQQFPSDKLPSNSNINDYINQKTVGEYDETSLIFLGYAKILNKMSLQLQAKVKFEFAKIMMQAEIESATEKQAKSSVLDVNSMNVAGQDCAVIITQPEAVAEENPQIAFMCAPPINTPGGQDLPQYNDDGSEDEVEKTERLIDIVKNYAILYDTSQSGYRNKNKKNKIWQNIAQVIREKDGETVKEKWNHLRDSYSIYLRSKKVATGQLSTEKHAESYPWAKQMKFFRPYVECLANTSEFDTMTNDPSR